MENFDRYKTVTAESYEKKDIMDYLVRVPSDRTLVPLISQIKGKKILDAGPGTGHYTRMLLKDNGIVGVDQNPHLCRLPITVHKGDATKLTELVGGEKFDVVLSTWMTEYLDGQQLQEFFNEARKVLKDDGRLITTIISKYGLGWLYITAAKMIRGINKYNYTGKRVTDMLKGAGFTDIEIVNLNSWLYVPWAYLVVAG
jgi:ubiquinone/menaquinone biosynthesis C-methylase UbiE